MTQDEIIEMGRQAHISLVLPASPRALETFAKLVAAKEREACAKLCDGLYKSWINIEGRYEFMGEGAEVCADEIRARGEA